MKELSIETVDIEPWETAIIMWFLHSYPNPPYHPNPPHHPSCQSPNRFIAHFESLVEWALFNISPKSEKNVSCSAVTMETCNQSDFEMLEIVYATSTDIDWTFFMFNTIVKKNVWSFPGNLASYHGILIFTRNNTLEM